MAVKDGVGNEVQQGDIVLIQLDKPFVIGRVEHVSDGGVDLLGGPKGQKSPGVIRIVCPQTIAFAPGPHARINVMFKLTNPEAQKIIEDLTAEANAGVPSNVAQTPTQQTAKPPVES